MSFNASGTFSLDSAAFVPNTLIQSAAVNTDFSGIATALTQLGTGTLNPTITITAVPASAPFGGAVYKNFITSDNLNVSAIGLLVGDGFTMTYGGSSTQGERIGRFSALNQSQATSASNAFRIYSATEGYNYTNSGDGGTNTGAGALGDYVGSFNVVFFDTAATNISSGSAVLGSLVTSAASSYKFGQCFMALGDITTSGASFDAAYAVSAFVAHTGFLYGLVFTDLEGKQPFKSTSTAIGAFWSGSTPTITNGVDFSNITFTGSAFKSTGFSVNPTGSVSTSGYVAVSIPVSVTVSSYSITTTDSILKYNLAGIGQTFTLTAASLNPGRILRIINQQAQPILSATSNVILLTGGAAGTAIVTSTAGKWAVIVATSLSTWQIVESN